MAGLGSNSNPMEIGAPKDWEGEVEQSLLEALAPVFDVYEDTIVAAEVAADAVLVSNIWAASERLANQGQARKMIDALPVQEEAHGLRPGPDDSAKERREALAAKRRGFTGNAAPDVRDVCAAAMGGGFVALHHVPEDEAVSYWPGINPGPAGFEWMSTNALVFAEVTSAGMSGDEFQRRTSNMASIVNDMLSVECAFDWFRHDEDAGEEGFFLDFSLLDEVGL